MTPQNTDDWAGFELVDGQYRKIATQANTRLLSKQLGLMLVRWQGVYKNQERTWLRWATLDGKLLPTDEEVAKAEHLARQAENLARQQTEHRADTEMAARLAAEAELARFKALLAQKS